jgi:hypothetical protein
LPKGANPYWVADLDLLINALDRNRPGPFKQRELRNLAEAYLLPEQQADRDEGTRAIGLHLPNVDRSLGTDENAIHAAEEALSLPRRFAAKSNTLQAKAGSVVRSRGPE